MTSPKGDWQRINSKGEAVGPLVPTKDHYNITSTEEYIKNLEQAGAKVLECNTDHDFNDFNTLNALRSFKI